MVFTHNPYVTFRSKDSIRGQMFDVIFSPTRKVSKNDSGPIEEKGDCFLQNYNRHLITFNH